MPVNATWLKALRRKIANPAWLAFGWFGLTSGITFLESPARFATGILTRPAAIDLGRVVFGLLNKVEIIALIVLLIIVRFSGSARKFWVECALLTLIVIAQSAWLLPELSARSIQIVAGSDPAPSFVHGAYATAELAKLAILLVLGFRALAPVDSAGKPTPP
jgi:hypothetical protein